MVIKLTDRGFAPDAIVLSFVADEIVRRTPLATLLPAAIAHENGELHGIRLEPALLQRTAALLQRKGAYRSAATSAFVALALEECQVRETTHQTRSTK
jgi:LysR family transcriptional regulator, cyn operon transcriptional activator